MKSATSRGAAMKRESRRGLATTRSSNRGAALVIAILLSAIASSIVAGLLWHQQLWLRQYDYQRDQSQAHSLARSGIDWARLILQEDARRSSIDHFGEQWAIRPAADSARQRRNRRRAD
jgi:general secretion pathway protein K